MDAASRQRRSGDVDPSRTVKYPTVPRKIRAASATTSACNLRMSHTIPEAFKSNPDAAMLFSKGTQDVESLRKARLELGASHMALDKRKDTRIMFGRTTVGLNGEETGKLADDIVHRVWREDISRQKVEEANILGALYRRRQMGGTSAAASSARLDRSASFMSLRSSQLLKSGSWRRSSPKHGGGRADSILLFPSVVKACERWLARARARVAARALVRSEHAAEDVYDASLKRRAMGRWLTMHHACLIGRRTSLNRIVKRWRAVAHGRAQMRRVFYRSLMGSVDRYRVHRLLCQWYAFHVAEGVLKGRGGGAGLLASSTGGDGGTRSRALSAPTTADTDPLAAIMRRPAGRSLYHRRPEIVFQAIDAAHATHVKAQRMSAVIEQHQNKSLRLPWDAWRAYIFTRRVKSNHYQMLRLHRAGRVAGRITSQCFSKWRFRMNASRSLSLYLYRLQSKALCQWRGRAQLLNDDQARVDQLHASKAALMKRSCLLLWKRKSKESTVLDLVGNCRVLENGAKLLPFALVFSSMIAASAAGHAIHPAAYDDDGSKAASTKPIGQWAEGRANAALSCRCFQQWKKVWTRRKQFEKVVKQQHRVYCGLLLRRAFAVWRSAESSWEDVVFIQQVVSLPSTTESTSGATAHHPQFPLGGSVSMQGKASTTPAASPNAAPVAVRLFGPRVDEAVVPWLTLRSVERHCRRSYTALGNLHAISMFAPRRLFEVDTSFYCHREMSGGAGVSDVTKSIADALFDEAECPNIRSLSQCSSVTTLQLELEASLLQSVTRRVRSSSVGLGTPAGLLSTATPLSNGGRDMMIPTWHLSNQGHHHSSVAALSLSRYTLQSSVTSRDAGDTEGAAPDEPVQLTNRPFYRRFLIRRVLQGLFVVGRVVIASKHASTRLNEFRDLMFSKHVVLSRERISDLQDALHGFAVTTGIAATVSRSQRLRDQGALSASPPSALLDPLVTPYRPVDRLANRSAYLDGCIEGRSTEFLTVEMVTEQEAFVVEFSLQLQGYRESLQQRYKQKLLLEAPQEILTTMGRLGFPRLDLTEVESNLGAIASFLNAQIAANVALRVAFRMRRAFALKRWAVVDAAQSYWTAVGVARYEPPRQSAPLTPQPPSVGRRKRRSTSGGSRRRRTVTLAAKKPAISLKHRQLKSEQVALSVAIRLRVHLALRHLPEYYTPASVVCLVPPKILVHTVARSQNAPDKLLR